MSEPTGTEAVTAPATDSSSAADPSSLASSLASSWATSVMPLSDEELSSMQTIKEAMLERAQEKLAAAQAALNAAQDELHAHETGLGVLTSARVHLSQGGAVNLTLTG